MNVRPIHPNSSKTEDFEMKRKLLICNIRAQLMMFNISGIESHLDCAVNTFKVLEQKTKEFKKEIIEFNKNSTKTYIKVKKTYDPINGIWKLSA